MGTDARPTAPTREEPESPAGDTGTDPGKEYRARTGIPVVPVMDGFRAYAILGVVLVHVIITTSSLALDRGHILVWGILPNMIDVLFILSGFVLFLPTVARQGDFGSVRAYAIRRAARVIPVYWVGLVVVLGMVLLWPTTPAPATPDAGNFLLHMAILQMPAKLVDPDFVIGFTIAGPVWTLSIEAIFYVLLPLVAGFYFRHPLLGLGIAAAITLGWKAGVDLLGGTPDAPSGTPVVQGVYETQFPAWAYSFALGMTGAWAYVKLRAMEHADLLRRRAAIVQLVSFVALGVFTYLLGRYAYDVIGFDRHVVARRNLPVAMGFTTSLGIFMVASALAPRPLQLPFAVPALRRFADISFGIYMIHLPLIFLVGALLTRYEDELGIAGITDDLGPFMTVVLTALPLTLLYGWASSRFVEQPIRRWAHRFGRRAETPEAPVPRGGLPTPVER